MSVKHRVIIWLGATLFVTTGVIGTLFIATSSLDLSTGCGNEILQTSLSPDGKHQAIHFQRDCGATTAFAYFFSVLPDKSSLPNEVGNITACVSNERVAKMEWVNEVQVNLYYQQAAPCTTHIGNVTVQRLELPQSH
jgi:hypothetical protein